MSQPQCYCNRPAALKKVTDVRKASYGKWFWGCKNFNDRGVACDFFEWYEGESPELGKVSADLQKSEDGGYRCQLCGKNLVIGGEHKCRVYGTYQCSCGNRWTSGYTWSGELQQCRRCGMPQVPESCRQLQRAAHRGSGGPHDSANCSMCQYLGYPCQAAAQPGQPGFVQRRNQTFSYGLGYSYSQPMAYMTSVRYMPY